MHLSISPTAPTCKDPDLDLDAREKELNAILAEYLRTVRRSPRTVADVASEKVGETDGQHVRSLVVEVSTAMSQICEYMRVEVNPKAGSALRRDRAAHEWATLRFPWMTKKNRSRAFAYGWWISLW